jgi:hypothetical protein
VFEEARVDKPAADGGRWRLALYPYPVRRHAPGSIDRLRRDLERLIKVADDPSKPLRAQRLLSGLRRASKAGLGAGFSLARRGLFRGPTLDEPPVTLVLETPEPSIPRIYIRAEPRFSPDLVEIPPLRTRFLDVWIEPGCDREGTPVQAISSIAWTLREICGALWRELGTATTTAEALTRAERILDSFEMDGFVKVACGRLQG